MARHGEATRVEDLPAAADRLRSMGLGQDRAGWVPEPPASPPPDPASVSGPSPASAREAASPHRPTPTAGDLAKGWIQDRLPPWTHGVVDRARAGSVVAAVGALVAVVLGGLLVLHHHAGATYSPSYDASATGAGTRSAGSFSSPVVSSPPTAAVDATSIVVDVGGRVHKPGLVTLPPGARVADAIAAAGGPLRHREIATVDLAARVSDGQLLLVGVKDGSAAAAAPVGTDPASAESSAPVALNSATLEQLETLPGIGPVLGQNIIDWRTAHSGFTSLEQLQQVSGIGPATYADLSPRVTL
jgi:competence protein ComEA